MMNIEHSVTGYSKRLPWSENPALLLVACGVLIGLNFPLAKLASNTSMSATTWVMLHSLGASLSLAFILLYKKQLRWFKLRELRYALIAGPITFAGPNVVIFVVVPKVGAAYSGILFALSPVCTLLLARMFNAAPISKAGVVGVLLGFCGAVGICISQGFVSPSNALPWIGLALTVPFILAMGNVYRTLDWPSDSTPELLAFWSHTAAFILYFIIASSSHGLQNLITISASNQVAPVQILLGALAAPLFFRLQRFGGPVTISQIGYIAAATSLLVSTLFLGERYPILSCLSAGIILIGIVTTLSASQKEKWASCS